jgi:acetyltransferase AlgX (SGNH hydrolase-like protein)
MTPAVSHTKPAGTPPSVRLRTAPMPAYAWITPKSGIALIIVFVVALALPLLGFLFNWRGTTLNENRNLAPTPDFHHDRLQDLPPKIDAYFKDHVGFRAAMVRASGFVLHRALQSSSDSVVLGKVPAPGEPQWLFYAAQGIIEDRLGLRSLSHAQLERWRKILERRSAWLAARGISYFYVVAPEKSTVYPEFLPDYMHARSSTNTTLDQLIQYLRSTGSPIHFIDLRDALSEEKSTGYLYYPSDTHWNGRGFFAAYREMLKALRPAAQPLQLGRDDEIRELPSNSYHDLSSMLGLPPGFSHSYFLAHRGSPKAVPVAATWPPDVDPPPSPSSAYALSSPDSGQPRLLVFHDSFFNAGPRTQQDQPLAAHFSRSYFAAIDPDDNTMKSFVDIEHPNIVLEEHAERILGNVPVDAPFEAVTPNLIRSNELPSYYLDSIGGKPAAHDVTVPLGPPITISGWAIDRQASAAADGVEIVIDGVPQPAAYGYQRTDVAAFYQRPAYLNSGFKAQIPASALSIGPHTLAIRVISANGKHYSESTYGRIIVR